MNVPDSRGIILKSKISLKIDFLILNKFYGDYLLVVLVVKYVGIYILCMSRII